MRDAMIVWKSLVTSGTASRPISTTISRIGMILTRLPVLLPFAMG